MYGFHGKACRDKQYSPDSWPELQRHFTLSRAVCLAHAKANLEAMCSMGFCCEGGSDGSHFHSLRNGRYQSYYSERGQDSRVDTFTEDEAAEMLVRCSGLFENTP